LEVILWVGIEKESDIVISGWKEYLPVARRRYEMVFPGYYRVEGWRVVPEEGWRACLAAPASEVEMASIT
jgi:hypothetical protein